MKLFTPKKYIKNYQYVDFNDLKQQGIQLIICDVDNTLVAHDEKLPCEKVQKFKQDILDNGFQFCLISNNVSERVSTFANELDVPFYSNAKKPLLITYKKIMKDYQLTPNHICGIGDQLLTDVLGGNRAGIYTILTHPLYTKDLIWTKINRSIENLVFKYLSSKKLLSKGDYDE